MKIDVKITEPVDGSKGKLFHAEGKAEGESCAVVVQKLASLEEGERYGLVITKKATSHIGGRRIIAYSGKTYTESKNGKTLNFPDVIASQRIQPEKAREQKDEALAEAMRQNAEMKAFIEELGGADPKK